MESWPVLAFLGMLLLLSMYWVIGFFNKMQITRENRKIAEAKVAELQKDQAKLSLDIAALKTEKGVEASIREKFGLAKEGEGEIVVVEDKNKPEVQEEKSGWFSNFFKNLFR